jgi:hypothetical protein
VLEFEHRRIGVWYEKFVLSLRMSFGAGRARI